MKYFYIIISLLLSFQVKSQLQTAHWYFGNNAGLDFGSGEPTIDLNGVLSTGEGCTSISDEYGNLMFYTDGQKVYDRTHNLMQNGSGLRGHSSSTSSAVIIPKPDDCNIYYVVTIDVRDEEVPSWRPKRGLEYNIVDMSLNGGLGAVIQKNIEIPINGTQQGYEKLAAISNSDKSGYWIVTHFEGNFYAFLINEEGVNMNPIISPTPEVFGGVQNIGYLKASPDGKRLALAMYFSGCSDRYLTVYDFDNETGLVTNEIVIHKPGMGVKSNFYGVEFSLDSQLLYATNSIHFCENEGRIELVQYNLNANPIFESKYVLHSGIYGGALQRGLDGKIYCTTYTSSDSMRFIGRIENPEIAHNPVTGESPFFTPEFIEFQNTTIGTGLPTFLNHYFRLSITINDLSLNQEHIYCTGTNLDFNFCHQGGEIDSIHWDFGDGQSSEELYPAYYYNEPGNFIITLTIVVDGETYIRTFEITIIGPPDVYDAEQQACVRNGDFYTFNLLDSLSEINPNNSDLYISFHLSESDAEQNLNPQANSYETNSTITIWVRVEDENGCFVVRQLLLIVNLIPEILIPEIFPICAGTQTEIFIESDNSQTVYWYENEFDEISVFQGNNFTTPILFDTTSFWVEITSEEGCVSERHEIIVEVTDSILPIFQAIDPICYGVNFELPSISENGISGTWSPSFDNTQTTTYTFFPDENQCVSENLSLTVEIVNIPIIELIGNLQICSNEIITITPTFSNGELHWFDDENDLEPIFIGDEFTTSNLTQDVSFWVEAHDGNCISERILIEISVLELPILAFQNPLPICAGSSVEIVVNSSNSTVNWFETEFDVNPIFTGNTFTTPALDQSTTYFVEAVNDLNCSSERVPIFVEIIDEIIPFFYPIEAQCKGVDFTLPLISQNGIAGNWFPEFNNQETTTYTFVPNQDQCTNEEILMTIEITDVPELYLPNNQIVSCLAQVIDIFVESSVGTVNWFANETDLDPIFIGNLYSIQLFATTTFWVEAQNGNCKSNRVPITIQVYPTPEMQEFDSIYICEGVDYEFSAPDGFDYYEWKNELGEIISTDPNVVFTQEGIYTLLAGINNIPCTVYREISVNFSIAPVITEIKSFDNTLTVYALGDGPFEYSLNQVFWQTSNTFHNLEPGVYFVYVRDLYGCGAVTKKGVILGFSNFISPNNDGYNDVWKIRGLEEFPNTRLQIFDRFGKIFVDKILNGDFEWNGQYNGRPLPSGAYWYFLIFESGEKLNGHINIRNY